jgi:hypothetical protein
MRGLWWIKLGEVLAEPWLSPGSVLGEVLVKFWVKLSYLVIAEVGWEEVA